METIVGIALLIGVLIFALYPWIALGGIWNESKRQTRQLIAQTQLLSEIVKRTSPPVQ